MTKLFLLALALFAPLLAHAACGGVAGVGKIADGTVQARTAEQAANTYVAADGYWTLCAVTTAAPPADCGGDGSFREWEDKSGARCTTANPYATDRGNPARDQGIKHRGMRVWQQWTGTHRGVLIERCRNGQREVLLSSCAAVTHCDAKVEVSAKRKSYIYDARSSRVPLGATVQALAADGSSIRLQCVGGNLVPR